MARRVDVAQEAGLEYDVEELYDALIEAGASEAKARAASRAVVDKTALADRFESSRPADLRSGYT